MAEEQSSEEFPYLPNSIAFNANISSEMFDVGGGYLAFNVVGIKGEEFPLILIAATKEEAEPLTIGSHISATGILQKLQGEWCIYAASVVKTPIENSTN